jgi:4-hydroxy-2-oxoheptanedioate aldolase
VPLPDLRSRLRTNSAVCCATWLDCRSPLSAECVATPGWDCIVVESQYSVTSHVEAVSLIKATTSRGVSVQAQIPGVDPLLIGRFLDVVAIVFFCPMINSADEAKALAAACRFPPARLRRLGPIRARPHSANEQGVTAAMIETASGPDNLNTILHMDGLDRIFIVPNDLAADLGLRPLTDPQYPGLESTLEAIAGKALLACLAVRIACEPAQYVRRMAAIGFPLRLTSLDLRVMTAGATRILSEMKGTA